MEFEWDQDKATSNYQKHGVYFSEAATVFADQNAITVFDEHHSSDEDRYISIGRTLKGHTVVVVFTHRMQENEDIVRLISARRADKDEELSYYSGEVVK